MLHLFENNSFLWSDKMSYINAEKVLPGWLIEQVRSYAGDGLIYIPPDKESRRAWGCKSGARQILEKRNKEIREKKHNVASIPSLAK